MSVTPLEPPIARVTDAPRRLGPGERDRLIRHAKALSWLSLAYMAAEGAIALTAALIAGSVALLGFGLDSAIEALASVIVIWRFTGTRRHSRDAEQRAERLVAVSFFLLAPYIAQDAARALITGEHPHTSWLGIGLSLSSIIVMPQLASAKHRLGQRLDSGATAGEGTQNMLCAYLAAGVLASLGLNAAFGLWWGDPVVALAIAALAIKEGQQTWQGKGCCATPPINDENTGCGDNSCSRSVHMPGRPPDRPEPRRAADEFRRGAVLPNVDQPNTGSSSAVACVCAHAVAAFANAGTSASSTNRPRTGTRAPSSYSSGVK